MDTTGAGDTFNSSFVYALSQGAELKDASEFATAAADIAIMSEGPRTGVNSAERVFRFMDKHDIK
ncbi:MAG: carbohydrate kinase family protein [Oscillospiraceae bacterium]|nr:carbohydrate kinase family protein [Oscillospiraceae bacterium]